MKKFYKSFLTNFSVHNFKHKTKQVLLLGAGLGLLLTLLLAACDDNSNDATQTATVKFPQFTATPTVPPTATPIPSPTPLANGPHQPNPAFLRWGYYIPDDPDSRDSLKTNLSKLDVVSPAYFIISADGEVRGSDHASDTALIQSKGVKLVPMLQNNPQWDQLHPFLQDPTWRDKIVAKLEDLINRYHYDGFQIDLELVNREDSANLTALIQELYAHLHPKGKLVTMAVGSKISDISNKFAGAYDYYALGSYLDYVTIMTYDYSYPGSDPGPIAPIEWVKTVAEYAASQFGARKVLLGIPFYGYEWNVTKNTYIGGRSYDGVQNLVTKNNGTIKYDEIYQSPYAEFVQDGDTYQVWFEDQRSIATKFDLIANLKLGGFAAWRLGLESTDGWNSINSATPPTARQATNTQPTLDSQYFADTGHYLSPRFKNFWQQHGSAKILGAPLTDEISETQPDGTVLQVQYFQNARLEYHPENKNPNDQILVGAIGREIVTNLAVNRVLKLLPKVSPISNNAHPTCDSSVARSSASCYFPQTGQIVANGFKSFWQNNGGLPSFGLALTPEFSEQNLFDGKTYTVQYFERARLQYEPLNQSISLGALGAQLLWLRGWLR
jgi:spore germination protein YaaH